MVLIPTLRKERLPRGFSYPAGAEIISAGLEGALHFGDLVLHFSWRDQLWTSKYRQRLLDKGDIEVLELNRPRPEGIALTGAHWVISLHAVPSEHNAAARTCMQNQILPALRKWLECAADEGPPFYFHALYGLSDGSVGFPDEVIRE